MCGIWGYISTAQPNFGELFKAFMQVQKRGPDKSEFKIINDIVNICLGFHRLAIMDSSSYGDQPFTFEIRDETEGNKNHRSIYAVCNGEIYNFSELVKKNNFVLKSKSDCEFLPQMYAKYGFTNMLKQLRGEFAICVIDIDHVYNNIQIYLGRDQTAVRPIFVGFDENVIAFSSILKGLIGIVNSATIQQLKRGYIMQICIQKTDTSIEMTTDTWCYHTLCDNNLLQNKKTENTPNPQETYIPMDTILMIHNTLIEAVECRLESDRPLGALLSGGLDSSLVVSIASAFLHKKGKKLRTFSIGIPGATDKEYAELVAKYCDTEHTHIEFSEEDFIGAIEQVIIATETYDITTVRASIGQYLVSKWIKDNTDIKVLLIGDGSDELCSGYMYFHNAPSAEASDKENHRLLEEIQYYDVLRADRCIAYNGIEARVPFLDHMFVDLFLSISPEYRVPHKRNGEGRKVEKWLLRTAFDRVHIVDDKYVPFLPEEVLWRKKEAFSDGVSSRKKSLFQIIQESVEHTLNDNDFLDPDVTYHIKPVSKEALYYRKLFNKHFDPMAATVIPHIWLPLWSGDVKDPSARVLAVYE
jgi:asparagine synthase (glutamine-hydrolysing)